MKVKSVNHSKRIPRIHSNWDTMGRLHLCMLYGLASNCMFNCNKETTFAKKIRWKNIQTNNATVERKYRSNFHEISRTAERHKTAAAKCSWKMENVKISMHSQSVRGDSRKKIHLPLFNQREWIKTAPKNALSNTENSIQKTTVTKDKSILTC